MDKSSLEKLTRVHPLLAEKVTALIDILGGDVRVVQGLRTYAEQDALYARGRTKSGHVVTNAKGGQSNHNFGLAVDLCPFTDGKPDWDNNAEFNRIGVNARSVGLEWGGDWHHIIDKPHVQLKGLTVRECRDLYERGGLPTVWEKASARNSATVPARVESDANGQQVSPANSPNPQTPANAGLSLMKLGMKGDNVRALQNALIARGYLPARELDGDFGEHTETAVKHFQRDQQLTSDGVAGVRTLAALGI